VAGQARHSPVEVVFQPRVGCLPEQRHHCIVALPYPEPVNIRNATDGGGERSSAIGKASAHLSGSKCTISAAIMSDVPPRLSRAFTSA